MSDLLSKPMIEPLHPATPKKLFLLLLFLFSIFSTEAKLPGIGQLVMSLISVPSE